MMVPESDT